MTQGIPHDVIEELVQHDGILRILQRPLLLRLFCDLCTKAPRAHEALSSLLRLRPHPVTLIEHVVGHALGDRSLRDSQEVIQAAHWDKGELADCAVKIYAEMRRSFGPDDLKRFVKPLSACGAEIPNPHATTLLWAAHKCPLLRVDFGRAEAEFAHGIFLEYFGIR